MVVMTANELIMMEHPAITSYTWPLSTEERAGLGVVSLADYDYLLGVLVRVNNLPSFIPPEVGRLVVYQVTNESGNALSGQFSYKKLELHDCSEFLEQEQIYA